MSNKIQGGSNASGIANVDANYQLKVGTETSASANAEFIGAVRSFNENDEGLITGITTLVSPEVDIDYRQRVSQDLQLDEEVFNYTAQNTGKHLYGNTTMTNTWTAGQLTTNGSSITTTTTGTLFQTRAMFPTTGTCTLSGDFELAFSAQPVTNTLIDFGFFQAPNTNPYAPTDGVYFRLNSSGLQGIVNNNGTETSTGVFPLSNGTGTWVYTNNKRYQFIVYMGAVVADFWVNDGTGAVKLGSVPLPAGQGRMVMSSSLPLTMRHAIVGGAAGGVIQTLLGAYNVRQGGVQFATSPAVAGNRMFGSYQGLSGGTMGSLASYVNNTNPTAAVPTNTTSTVLTGLGGQGWETDTLAVNTDGIIMSYQVPAGTANVQGKRLVLRGLKLDTFVQTALTGGGYNEVWTINWGHTAVSLATAEAATTKARRVLPLGVRAVPAATAALTKLETITLDLGDAPIYVNPGEFIAIAKKKVGTAPSAGVMAHTITPIYGWE
jgi:hypothetical protein